MLNPLKPIPDGATVNCLFDEETREWIPETINAFFDQETAAKIMQVQISRHGGEDFACWPHDKRGIYTVRSAYNFVRSSNFFLTRSSRGRGLNSRYNEEEKSWKAIWKVNVPNKMKIHLWRFAHDCLPSGVQLTHRQIPTSDSCVFCGREETIVHSLLVCQHAQEVWRLIKSSFRIQLNMRDILSTKSWLFDFLSDSTDLETTVLAVTFWHIWESRNEVRNNHAQPNPYRTAAKSIAYVDLIVQHCFKPEPDKRRETLAPRKWSPPPPDRVLVNVDAALFEDIQRMASGVVIRDHLGHCLLAASEPLLGFTSPEVAEALALRRAVALACDRGFDKVTFASDCLSLIQRVNSSAQDRSQVGSVVADIKFQAKTISSVIFIHVHRSINDAAHVLARTCNVAGSGFILDYAPDCILEAICIDRK
jgi:hypothetical protein